MALYNSIGEITPLAILIKEVIEKLGIDSEKMKFVSISTVYKNNIGAIVVETIPNMTPTPKHIVVKYHWFRQNDGREFVIRKTKSENQKADIYTKGLQSEFVFRIRKLICHR